MEFLICAQKMTFVLKISWFRNVVVNFSIVVIQLLNMCKRGLRVFPTDASQMLLPCKILSYSVFEMIHVAEFDKHWLKTFRFCSSDWWVVTNVEDLCNINHTEIRTNYSMNDANWLLMWCIESKQQNYPTTELTEHTPRTVIFYILYTTIYNTYQK